MALTKTDRERVPPPAGRGTSLGPRPAPAGRALSAPAGGAEGAGPQPNNGAGGVKEHGYRRATTGSPGRTEARRGKRKRQIIHTTLGNGYLGSRIDEERSEMRYLV